MSKSREQYEKILEKLKFSYTEEDIIENLTQIVKGFSVHFFKDDLFQNPFYKLLLVDIKNDVLVDLFEIKKSILNVLTTSLPILLINLNLPTNTIKGLVIHQLGKQEFFTLKKEQN